MENVLAEQLKDMTLVSISTAMGQDSWLTACTRFWRQYNLRTLNLTMSLLRQIPQTSNSFAESISWSHCWT